MDRRSASRCPTCQGPGVEDASMPDGVRCRRSICLQNHSQVVCPRCQEKDLDGVMFKDGKYEYTCKECTHKWTVAAAPT